MCNTNNCTQLQTYLCTQIAEFPSLMAHSRPGSHSTSAHKLVVFVAFIVPLVRLVLFVDRSRIGIGLPTANVMVCDDTSRIVNIMARASHENTSDLCLVGIVAAFSLQLMAILVSANKKNSVILTLKRFTYSFSKAQHLQGHGSLVLLQTCACRGCNA